MPSKSPARPPPLELQRTVPADPAPLPVQRVLRVRHPFRVFPARAREDRRGRPLGQRFVRPHLVVLFAEAVEAHLLLAAVGRRRPRRRGLQHPVHALVPPVLLRLARLDPLQLDAQLQPPSGQLAQPPGPGRGERAPVVAAHPVRQAVLPEHFVQRGPRGRARHLAVPRAG